LQVLWDARNNDEINKSQKCEEGLVSAPKNDWQHAFVAISRRKLQQYCDIKGLDSKSVIVEPFLSKYMREHQRQGVQFMFDCVTGMRPSDGYGCILADDMVMNLVTYVFQK
jgi:SNF2 family DNA or RNA helicase